MCVCVCVCVCVRACTHSEKARIPQSGGKKGGGTCLGQIWINQPAGGKTGKERHWRGVRRIRGVTGRKNRLPSGSFLAVLWEICLVP